MTVRAPQGDDQNAYLNLGPSPEESRSPEKLSWFLKTKGEEILKDYPKSNYAAWIQWDIGKSLHDFLDMDKLSVEEELVYNEYLKKMESGELGSKESFRDELLHIVELWEPLYRDFPKFKNRPFVMQGLAQTYIRLGEFQKAIPLIKELLQRYPETESGKKIVAYKELMVKQKLWP